MLFLMFFTFLYESVPRLNEKANLPVAHEIISALYLSHSDIKLYLWYPEVMLLTDYWEKQKFKSSQRSPSFTHLLQQ